mgnify:CR=1 FL=1
MKRAQGKIKENLVKLEEELRKKYPPEHWNHTRVWIAYWSFIEEIEKTP